MTQQTIYLSDNGMLSLTESSDAVAHFEYDLHSYLGDDAVLDFVFLGKKSNPGLSNIVAQLTWRDGFTNDVIVKAQGTLSTDENNLASLWSVAGALPDVKHFEIVHLESASITANAIKQSTAFNDVKSLGKNKISLTLPSDHPNGFLGDYLFEVITTMTPKPSYIGLAQISDLSVYTPLYRAMEKLNIPLDIELDPTLTKDQAISLVESVDANHHLVQFLFSPNVSRPRDAISLLGRKKPAYVLGTYLGMKQLRNSRTTASGILRLADPVAGESYPFDKHIKGLQKRDDIQFDEPTLEEFAIAKINVVRQIEYDSGTKFVLSDILTQYNSKTSALRLSSSADIARYTTNGCVNILKRHMLKRTAVYLKEASRDIQKFLDDCYGAGLIVQAEDLGGQPYQFSLVPDQQMPFERVRLYLARRPEGATRSAVFDEDVLVK